MKRLHLTLTVSEYEEMSDELQTAIVSAPIWYAHLPNRLIPTPHQDELPSLLSVLPNLTTAVLKTEIFINYFSVRLEGRTSLVQQHLLGQCTASDAFDMFRLSQRVFRSAASLEALHIDFFGMRKYDFYRADVNDSTAARAGEMRDS